LTSEPSYPGEEAALARVERRVLTPPTVDVSGMDDNRAMEAGGTVTKEDNERLETAWNAYREVLDATKHQDEKIGRFLTAIAFLFTGAIAFGTRAEFMSVQLVFEPGWERALPAIFLAGFLVLSLISVLLLVVAIGPNLTFPRPERDGPPSSRLFFLSIAAMTTDRWNYLWRAPDPMPGQMLRMLVSEAHNLATKTDFKYKRTNEARAIFSLGLLLLALSIILGFEALANHDVVVTDQGVALLEWDMLSRRLVGAVLAAFAFVLAYDYLRLEQELDNYFDTAKTWRMRALYVPLIAAPTYIVAVLAPMTRTQVDIGRTVALVAVGITAIALLARVGRATSPQAWAWRLIVVLGAGAVAAATFIAADKSEEARLILAFIPVLLLELPRLFIASHSLRTNKRRMREWIAIQEGRG
jgi:hypothetical protein